MSAGLSFRQANGVSIVDVSGRLTLGGGATELRDKLREMSGAGHKKILLNLGDLTVLDSTGIGVLVSSYATITSVGGHLKLLNLTSRVKDLLFLTKLLTLFEVFDEERAAVDSFGEPAVAVPAARG